MPKNVNSKKKPSGNLLIEKRFVIPIYDVTLYVVVARDLNQERKRFDRFFGPLEGSQKYCALCSSDGPVYALFFMPTHLSLEVIGHEVFHLTSRILEWVEITQRCDGDESGALLHGYLLNLVMKAVGK